MVHFSTIEVVYFSAIVDSVAGFKFRGGTIVDWKGELSERVARAADQLRQFYGESVTEVLARFGWEGMEKP